MSKFDIKNWDNTLKVKFDDGEEFRLPDLSYNQFINSEYFMGGSSDIEYDMYLKEHNMVELTDFNNDAINEITLIDEQPHRGRVLKFKLVYDSNNDESFNEEEYFGKQ